MPIYEYKCKECGSKFETIRSFLSADEQIECAVCASKNTFRILSTFCSHTSSANNSSISSSSCGNCSGGNCATCH